MTNPVIIGDAQLYLGDCLEILPTLGKVDAVITSPPYDNLREYGGHAWDFEGIALALSKGIKIGGVIVWVVGDAVIDGSESCTSFTQALHFKSLGLRLHDTMIYEKAGTAFPEQTRYYQQFEYMFILSNCAPKTVNLIRDKKNRWGGETTFGNSSNRQKDGTLKQSGKREIGETGIRPNIWRYTSGFGFNAADSVAHLHPAIFPERLASDHAQSWTNPADTILDPFMGSGTTGVACANLGRKFIGIEIEKKYFDIACERIDNAYRQQRLFA